LCKRLKFNLGVKWRWVFANSHFHKFILAVA
jgi:hypothetical protein